MGAVLLRRWRKDVYVTTIVGAGLLRLYILGSLDRLLRAAVISPKGNVESYSDLLAYLGCKLGRRVELVQRQTYAEVNHLVKNGNVDLAFVCTSAYVVSTRVHGT